MTCPDGRGCLRAADRILVFIGFLVFGDIVACWDLLPENTSEK